MVVPLARAATSPAESAAATAESLELHVKTAPSTALPPASSATASSRAVSPSEENRSEPGVMVRPLTTWATVTIALPDTPPVRRGDRGGPVGHGRGEARFRHRHRARIPAGPFDRRTAHDVPELIVNHRRELNGLAEGFERCRFRTDGYRGGDG